MMIEASVIIALIVLSIHYTMLDGEIFGKLGNWFARHLPVKVHPSVFECNVCMTPWYGTPLYLLLFQKGDAPWWYIFPTLLVAMGINVVINKWAPKEEIEIKGQEAELSELDKQAASAIDKAFKETVEIWDRIKK